MERWDDLQFDGLMLLQDDALPCFTQDAVLLCRFMRLTPRDTAVDLGSGTGLISVLGQRVSGARFCGVELNGALCALARRSAAYNGQDIAFHEMDVRDAPDALGRGTFTAAVCNPPYFDPDESGPDAARALARHGTDALGTFLGAAFLLLKNGGRLYLCWPCARLCDAFCALRANRLEPKRARLVARDDAAAPYLALIEAKKLAKPGILWDATRYLDRQT